MQEIARHPLDARLAVKGPKRLLCLDAYPEGPSAFAEAAGLLVALEGRLAQRARRRTFRLSDYFDAMCGVSWSAPLAAVLSIGRGAREAAHFAEVLAHAEGPAQRSQAIRAALGEARLSGAGTRSIAMLLTQQNGELACALPSAVEAAGPDDPLLADLVERSEAGFGQGATGSSLLDCPALSALRLACATPPGGLGWEPGADRLMLVSLGRVGSGGEALAVLAALAAFGAPAMSPVPCVTLRRLEVSPTPGVAWTPMLEAAAEQGREQLAGHDFAPRMLDPPWLSAPRAAPASSRLAALSKVFSRGDS